jgi:hypothetical protein
VLIAITPFARVPPMAKGKEQDEPGVWNFREVPRDIIVKAKIQAAVENKSVKALLMDLVEAHWQELERKGILPKGK